MLLSGHYQSVVWEMPVWVHTNILGYFTEMIPDWAFILHYHTLRRLVKIGRTDLLTPDDIAREKPYHSGDEDDTPEQYKKKMEAMMAKKSAVKMNRRQKRRNR
jgi:hypothetical protein